MTGGTAALLKPSLICSLHNSSNVVPEALALRGRHGTHHHQRQLPGRVRPPLSVRSRQCRKGRSHTATASLADTAQVLLSQALQPVPGLEPALFINTTVFVLGIRVLLAGLTPLAVANSWLLGTVVFAAFGWGGYVMVCLYFLVGSAVTKVKLKQKQAEGIAEARSGRRSVGSVWGSGSAGIACAAMALLQSDNHAIWQVAFVASFVSKLSDTVSSEIGKAYGKTTFLVTTLKPVTRGTEGAVSTEGTAAGAAAALAFSAVALALGQVNGGGALIATVAAVVANLFESYLGAASQGRVQWLTNDAVNAIQIAVAAAVAVMLQLLWPTSGSLAW
mmetsp:Transcript_6534/g.18833  ORF Transcript_6534/g.18833 Transcript_6534/m.18833 type:complete len:333 (-) Transcript_6534:330-1328(-)